MKTASASGLISAHAYRKAMGWSDVTLWRRIREGHFTAHRFGPRLYLDREEIERFEQRLRNGDFAKPQPGALRPKRSQARLAAA